MPLPGNALSEEPVLGAYLVPDDNARELLIDWELGGIALGDGSQGLEVQVWKLECVDGVVTVTPQTSGSPTELFTDVLITEVSLSFDQNMRPVIAYISNGVCCLRWFDTAVAETVTTTYEQAVSPMVCNDDKRPLQIANSDVLFFYLKNNQLCYRQQRERYTVERVLKSGVPSVYNRISSLGMTTANRIQINIKAT